MRVLRFTPMCLGTISTFRTLARDGYKIQPLEVHHLSGRVAVRTHDEALLAGRTPCLKARAALAASHRLFPQLIPEAGCYTAEEDPGLRLDHPATQVPP